MARIPRAPYLIPSAARRAGCNIRGPAHRARSRPGAALSRDTHGRPPRSHLVCPLLFPRPYLLSGEAFRPGPRADVGESCSRRGARRIRPQVSPPAHEILREHAQVRGAAKDGRFLSAEPLSVLSRPPESGREPSLRGGTDGRCNGDLKSEGDDRQGHRMGAGGEEGGSVGPRRRPAADGGADEAPRLEHGSGEVFSVPSESIGGATAVQRVVAGEDAGCGSLRPSADVLPPGRPRSGKVRPPRRGSAPGPRPRTTRTLLSLRHTAARKRVRFLTTPACAPRE